MWINQNIHGLKSPCTLTPTGGTWKEQCINIQYLVPTSAWVTQKGNRDPRELHNNMVSRCSNKKKWKMYAKLLQIRYALFKEVQICKVMLKVTFSLNKEQRKMTTRISKEERSQQLTWNYKTWECSSTDSSNGKRRFTRQFSNASFGFSLSISVSQILWTLLLTYLIFLHISSSTCLSPHPSSPTFTSHLTYPKDHYSYKRNKAMTSPLHPCTLC